MYNYYPAAYQNAFNNPYQSFQPKTEIVKVNGRPGADAYQMAPNSSVLLLDESQPIVYLKTTDRAGYASVSMYSILPYEEPKPVNMAEIEERLSKLEERVNESYYSKHEQSESRTADESNSSYSKRSEKPSNYARRNDEK